MSTLLFLINDDANVLGLDWDAHLKSSTGTIKDFDASKVDIGPTPTCVQECTFRMPTTTLSTVHTLSNMLGPRCDFRGETFFLIVVPVAHVCFSL